MDDDWDDWGDGKQNSESAESEEWDWPVENESRNSPEAVKVKNIEKPTPKPDDSRESNGKVGLEQIEEEARLTRQFDEMAETFFDKLRSYQLDLADPSVREGINKVLSRSNFTGLARYYEGRDNLADYTLETELRRMRYEVVTSEGDRVGAEESGGAALRDYLSERKDHTMVRMANQSVFADMLEALQGSIMRPDLEISVISRDCSFSLDFSSGILDAQSLFGVSTVGAGGSGEQGTLEIAQIKGKARVDTRSQTYSQSLLSPQLRMVFDDDMRASARILARHSLMDGGLSDGGQGGQGGVGLRGMGSLRQSLARVSSDSVGRAASASTGLLANVVAGVGSAIGASRNGPGVTDGGLDKNGEQPVLRLYRKSDADHPAVAPHQPSSTVPQRTIGMGRALAETECPAKESQVFKNGRRLGGVAGGDLARARGSGVCEDSDGGRPVDDEATKVGDVSIGKIAAETERRAGSGAGLGRSAVGIASATGGAVLRGLWGGLQGVQSVATAFQKEGVDSVKNSEDPVIRLYRRDDDDDKQ